VDKTTRRSIDAVLAEAQARLRRLRPVDAVAAMSGGWTLEWRVDPTSETHGAELTGREARLILICRDGYSPSLAAVRLHELGFTETTDVIGGFGAWLAAGLPVER
jgi:rhodanese-related sulfurtransferase